MLRVKHRCERFGVIDNRRHELSDKEAVKAWMSSRDCADLVCGAHRVGVYLE